MASDKLSGINFVNHSDLSSHSFEILGRRIILATNLPDCLPDFLRSFDHWAAPHSRGDIYVQALHIEEWPTPLKYYRIDDKSFLGHFGLYEAHTNTYYRLNAKPKEMAVEVLFHGFEWAAHKMIQEAGHRMIHAAGVEHDGKAVALVGDAGSGKSTLSIAFMQELSWNILSDDKLIFTSQNGNNVYVYGYSRRVRIGGSHLDVEGDVLWESDRPKQVNASRIYNWVDGKINKRVILAPRSKFVSSSILQLIIFVSVHPLVEKPSIKALSPDEVREMLFLNEVNVSCRIPTSDQPIIDASKIPGYMVLLGLDVHQNVEQIAALVKRVLD